MFFVIFFRCSICLIFDVFHVFEFFAGEHQEIADEHQEIAGEHQEIAGEHQEIAGEHQGAME